MAFSKEVLFPLAIALGVLSGLAWFGLGESLDDQFSNFMAWFVCPALAPFLMAVLLYFVDRSASRAANSLGFFLLFYAAHWLPMGLFLAVLTLPGTRM